MVRAYHVIFSTYGFWLPNDPRGSWSDYVRSWEVFRYGPATKTVPRRSHGRDEHDHDIRKVVGQLKGEATKQLKRDALHPFGHLAAPPSPWARRGWNVFLDSDEAIRRAIRYVEQNPVKEGKPPQKRSFVVPLINAPFNSGRAPLDARRPSRNDERGAMPRRYS
ncbi:MAG: hypothetical protein ISS69_08915 [Phycisphaerae bacterium]|nr:hypothetical protein [Phycisphaerae bacterium]